MNPNEYQKAAERTLGGMETEVTLEGKPLMYVWLALGAADEAGEVAGYVKKHVLHQHGPVVPDELAKEIGDVLWYLAGLCTVCGISMEEVMIRNIAKLEKRFPKGFSRADSVARVDVVADMQREERDE